jgi:hypothetical protein
MPESKMNEIIKGIISERTKLAVSLEPKDYTKGFESISPIAKDTIQSSNT